MKHWLVTVVIGVAASTTLTTTGVGTANAAGSTPSGSVRSIVYAADDGGVWVVNADGTHNREVSTVMAGSVSYAPGGTRIAYTARGAGAKSGTEVWTRAFAGGPPHQLTHNGANTSDVAWSPDGKWIAYDVNASTGRDIFRVPAGGGTPTRMTFAGRSGCYADAPAWSPDSSAIVYDAGALSCTSAKLVVQRLGHPGRVVASGPYFDSPSFTTTGNLVYIAPCNVPIECGTVAAGWESNADGSSATIVAPNVDCQAGDECLNAMIGEPSQRGWIEDFGYADPDGNDPSTCFDGAYQKAGVVSDIAPSFCLPLLINGYDATT